MSASPGDALAVAGRLQHVATGKVGGRGRPSSGFQDIAKLETLGGLDDDEAVDAALVILADDLQVVATTIKPNRALSNHLLDAGLILAVTPPADIVSQDVILEVSQRHIKIVFVVLVHHSLLNPSLYTFIIAETAQK